MPTPILLATPVCSPTTTAVDVADELLHTVADRLAELVARTGEAQALTDWYSPAGRAFGDRADGLRRRVVGLQAGVDDVIDGVRRMRAELAARAGA